MSDQTVPLRWRCRDRELLIQKQTLIMGVLNVTPDSFYDGGRHADPEEAIRHGLKMVDEGADIVDVGGESTRPGSERVDEEEEIRRVIPVIRALRESTAALLSVDTMKAVVARRAVEAGAHIINDVSALTYDPAMTGVAAESGAGIVLMHMLGEPRTMQEDPRYDDVVSEVDKYLGNRLEVLAGAGIDKDRIAIDPGIGFGKTVEHNLRLLANLPVLARRGRPVVIGVSRKSVLGRITGREPGERLAAGLGAMAAAILRGAQVVRTHDVKEACDAARVVDRIRQQECLCYDS